MSAVDQALKQVFQSLDSSLQRSYALDDGSHTISVELILDSLQFHPIISLHEYRGETWLEKENRKIE